MLQPKQNMNVYFLIEMFANIKHVTVLFLEKISFLDIKNVTVEKNHECDQTEFGPGLFNIFETNPVLQTAV